MEALDPARLSFDRHPQSLTLQNPDPVRRLRICLLGYRSHPHGGGQGVYLRYLSKALHELGHEVHVISGQPYPELDRGVRLIPMPGMNLYENGLCSLRPWHLCSLSNVIEWLSKLSGGFAEPQAFGRRVVKYLRIRRGDYDIVHDNQSLSYGMLALQHMGIPLVTTIHHPITRDRQLALDACRWWWQRLLARRWHSFLGMQKRVARMLDHVVTVSESSRRDIACDFGIAADRIVVVPNGVDTTVFSPCALITRKPLQLMVTASADQPLKGVAVLLQAFAALLSEYPGLRLLMVGRPRARGATEQLIARLGLVSHIDILSAITTDDLVRHYRESTIVVVPSLYEGFGLPAAEAMACGAPVVSSDGGALREVAGDGAVVVPAGDAAALRRAIGALLDDPRRRAELGEHARRHVLEHFCWRHAARLMTQHYEQVLAVHGNRRS